MDTNAGKTPATLPLAAWQALAPAAAAQEVKIRIDALPPELRSAAVAWLKPERELAAELGGGGAPPGGAGLPATERASFTGNLAPPADSLRPLHGVPYVLKDLFDLAGVPTCAGSTFLDRVRPTPTRDSRIVQRLRELGAGCAGKTHLVEFASGLTGENPHFGDCPHPLFPDRLTGGSSSGSAAMVAAGVVPLAIGTDTGGSIRVPAAFCGLYGFRLTPGDPLIADAFPLAPTMDTAGWLTANAADMLTVWRSLTARPEGSPHPPSRPGSLRGGHLPMAALLPQCDPAFAGACDAAATRLCPPASDETRDRLLAGWREAVDAYITIGMSEAFAVHRNWLTPYREYYDPLIWQRFTDAGHFSPEKIAGARATLQAVRTGWRHFFAEHAFLVLPAAPGPAPRKADCTPELRRNILTLTAPASLGGLPVLTLPVPLPSGLTAGLQVVMPRPDSEVVERILRQWV